MFKRYLILTLVLLALIGTGFTQELTKEELALQKKAQIKKQQEERAKNKRALESCLTLVRSLYSREEKTIQDFVMGHPYGVQQVQLWNVQCLQYISLRLLLAPSLLLTLDLPLLGKVNRLVHDFIDEYVENDAEEPKDAAHVQKRGEPRQRSKVQESDLGAPAPIGAHLFLLLALHLLAQVLHDRLHHGLRLAHVDRALLLLLGEGGVHLVAAQVEVEQRLVVGVRPVKVWCAVLEALEVLHLVRGYVLTAVDHHLGEDLVHEALLVLGGMTHTYMERKGGTLGTEINIGMMLELGRCPQLYIQHLQNIKSRQEPLISYASIAGLGPNNA